MKQVRVGIIGVNNMGRAHMAKVATLRNATLTAVCDINRQLADQAAGESKSRAFYDHRDLLKAGACDAVVIATPHYAHTTIGIDTLKAGLHVLIEKPISVHKADCERLIAAHTKRKQVFAAMFNQRTDPRYQKLRQLIRDGELGALDRITWIITDWFRTDAYYGSSAWRATWAGEGGGVLLNQCPHNLDLWQWMFGMPKLVRAFCKFGRKHNIEVEDEVTAYMEYESGCSGTFITSTGEAPGTNRLEVAGEMGKVVIEGGSMHFTRNEVSSTLFLKTTPELWARPKAKDIDIPVNGIGGQHAEVLQNFIDAIVERKPLIAPAAEGIKSVELGNAMLYSSETGTTVEMPLDGKAFERMLKTKIRTSRFVKKTRAVKAGDISQSFR